MSTVSCVCVNCQDEQPDQLTVGLPHTLVDVKANRAQPVKKKT